MAGAGKVLLKVGATGSGLPCGLIHSRSAGHDLIRCVSQIKGERHHPVPGLAKRRCPEDHLARAIDHTDRVLSVPQIHHHRDRPVRNHGAGVGGIGEGGHGDEFGFTFPDEKNPVCQKRADPGCGLLILSCSACLVVRCLGA